MILIEGEKWHELQYLQSDFRLNDLSSIKNSKSLEKNNFNYSS